MSATPPESPTSWFRTAQDAVYVEHLLNLYFAWHHPFYAVFSVPHFRSDMRKGRNRYCSSMLLNAALAMACNYSDRAPSDVDLSQLSRLGDSYFAEAKELVDRNDEASLTTVQTLAIMSLRELSCGRDSNSHRYSGRAMRMAIEMNLHMAASAEGSTELGHIDNEMAKLTFWGVYNVEMSCALSMGRVPQIQSVSINVDKPANIDKLDSLIWQPYEDINVAASPNAQHAMQCLHFVKQLSELSQLVNELNLALYAPGEMFTPGKLQSAHARYQAWYQNMPEMFHLQNTGMPHVIVLHIYYHSCLMQ